MKRDFTMVELLVVIAVVAIFAALLAPAAAGVPETAGRTANCVGNLKRIGTGVAMYADANNGWQPLNAYSWTRNLDSGGSGFRNSFGVLISEYVGEKEYVGSYSGSAPNHYQGQVFRCPDDPDSYKQWTNSYSAINFNIMAHNIASAKAYMIPFKQLRAPSSTMCIMDAKQHTNNHPRGFINAIGYWHKGAWRNNAPLAVDTNGNGIRDSKDDKPDNHFNGAAFRHDSGNSLNSLFCDGHVQTLNEEEWVNQLLWGKTK